MRPPPLLLVLVLLAHAGLTAAQWSSCPSTKRSDVADDAFEIEELPAIGPPRIILRPGDRRRSSSSSSSDCQTFSLPLTPAAPTTATISVFVRRFYTASSLKTATRQMWMFAGGPGQYGAPLYSRADYLAAVLPDTVVYVPDQRGTGRSTRLHCPSHEDANGNVADMVACGVEMRDTLGLSYVTAFSTTNAALDFIALIQRMQATTTQQSVVLYGASYGTYLAYRIMLLRPTLVTSAVLDGVIDAGASLLDSPARDDVPFKYLMGLCSGNAVCSAKLGNDPAGFMQKLWAASDAKTCPAYATSRDQAMNILGAFTNPAATTPWLLPSAYRAVRCNSSDIEIISDALNKVVGSSTAEQFSYILFNVIGQAELTGLPQLFTEGDWRAYYNISSLLYYNPPGAWFSVRNTWPFLYSDPYDGVRPNASVATPILILSGELDFNTPYSWARDFAALATAPNVRLLKLPYAGHVTIFWESNPMVDPKAPSCGMSAMVAFISDPALTAAALSALPCFAGIAQPAVDGSTFASAMRLRDAWEGAGATLGPVPALAFALLMVVASAVVM